MAFKSPILTLEKLLLGKPKKVIESKFIVNAENSDIVNKIEHSIMSYKMKPIC